MLQVLKNIANMYWLYFLSSKKSERERKKNIGLKAKDSMFTFFPFPLFLEEDIAFSLSHPDFNRLSGNGGGGKDSNPNLSPTFHLTGHCPTTGFYLTGSHPTPFDSLQPKGPSKEVIVLGSLDPTLSGLTVLDLFRTEHTG